jgi:arylsulfatase A-like enzyme
VSEADYVGYECGTTPVIDALAQGSVNFRTAYAPAASTAHVEFTMLTSSSPLNTEKRRHEGVHEAAYCVLYDGNLASVDAPVGAIFVLLKQDGKCDATAVVLIADHGEAFRQHDVYGHGRHINGAFLRIPMLVRIPGMPEPAGRDEEFVERPVFLRNTHNDAPEYGLRAGRWKWIYKYGYDRNELYDLRADPFERHDLAASFSVPAATQLLRELVPLWIAMETEQIDPVTEIDPEVRERLKALGYF